MNESRTTDSETPTIFLAMVWGGGGPYAIWQIIHVYDWINRGTPRREELETALNTLLSLDLIVVTEDGYTIRTEIGCDFEAFRKKKRIGKFKAARLYFDRLESKTGKRPSITITPKEYAAALKKYKKFMAS